MYLFFIIIQAFFVTHDFHVSQCEIRYRPSEAQVAISLHVFIDDLELALKNKGYDSIYLCTQKERLEANALITDYLGDHFVIELDGKPLSYHFLGKEVSEDLMGVWCYIEALNVAPFSVATIRNKVLLEVFDDQKNIVSFEYAGFPKKHFLFDREDPVKKFIIQ